MPRVFSRLAISFVCLSLTPAALADLSGEDVWNDWQMYGSSFGYEVTGEPNKSGGSLVVKNMTMESQQDTTRSTISFDQVTFAEQSDGSVSITLPSVMPMTMSTELETGEIGTIKLNYQQSGLLMVATGTPDNLLYTYTADAITLGTSGIDIAGLSAGAEQPSISVVAESISGTTSVTVDGIRRYEQVTDASRMTYDIGIADPDGEGNVSVKGGMQDLRFSGDTALPLRTVPTTDMNAMLAAGFAVSGVFSYGENAVEISGSTPEGSFSASATAQSGAAGIAMNADKLSYNASQTGTQFAMMSDQIPLPLSFEVAETGFQLAVPVSKSDAPQDFSLALLLDGFEMSDMLWGLFDPTSQLPRDPAVVALDLAGRALLGFDFLNPDIEAMQAEALTNPPVELEMVDISKLQVTVAGADLTGEGRFTFNNSAGKPPQPVGAIDLRLVGGNALIDKLVAVGLLPEQQAMGARMMLGLLAVPGDAPDTLNSRIEINEQGHVSANGQRIQ